MKNGKVWLSWFVVLLITYSIYSFAYAPPNLVFFGGDLWWQFQNAMWKLGFSNRLTSSLIFTLVIGGLFFAYGKILSGIKKGKITARMFFGLLIVSILVLIFSNPALSYDIYNYIFNAKMVVAYGSNPHVAVATDFSNDNYLRFMHNVHTPAPYGYGWTGLSIIPYVLGFGKLKLEIVLMKIAVGIFFVGLIWYQRKILELLKVKDWLYRVSLFALNPLVLIETFGNGHNDVVMMALAMGGIYLTLKAMTNKRLDLWIGVIILMAASISIKYASVLLIMGMGLYLLIKKLRLSGFGNINAGIMLAPLISARSQRFLPWYLIWSLAFLPLMENKLLVNALIVASFGAMLGYLPYIMTGEYLPGVLGWRTVISFGLPIGYVLIVKSIESIRGVKGI